ncbi:hypothetical protein BB560_003830 [Smittium megazygosporum]|uniref:F-box domain-containing protein n=1 Tax=Smittium megazygosporum TaxID=133381 RepID=A0A2T9ZAX8_9FUNG|nr:hypothetical protein BB560_003830 [Smittium megazygosporum]
MLLQLPEQLIVRIFAYSQNNEFRFANKSIFKSTNSLENNGEYLLARFGENDIFKANQDGLLNKKFLNERNVLNVLNLALFDNNTYNNILYHSLKNNWLKVVNKLIHSFRFGSEMVDIRSYFGRIDGDGIFLERIVDVNGGNGRNILATIDNKSFEIFLVLLKAHKLAEHIKQKTKARINLKMHEKVDASCLQEEHIDILFESKQIDCIELLVCKSENLELMDSILVKGVLNGATDVVKEVLDRITITNETGSHLLKIASKNGDLEIVRLLTDSGVDIHTEDDWALRWASYKGHFELVKYLVENGADIHAENDCALRWASTGGYLDIVKLLVENGANVQADDNRAFRNALRHGKIETMEYLLNNGSDTSLDFDQEIKFALGGGRSELIDYAFKCVISYKERNYDQTKQPTRDREYNFARRLVDYYFNLNNMEYILRSAFDSNDFKEVKYIIENVVKDKSKDKLGFELCTKEGSLDMCQYFIERDLSINTLNERVKIACNHGNLDVLKLLFRFGANIEDNKSIALSTACNRGHFEIVEYLLDSGIDIHADNEIALMSASKAGNVQMIKLLIENGVSLNENGERALVCTIENNKSDAAKFLFEQGVKLEADKESLLVKASNGYHSDLVRILIELGADIHCESDIALRKAIEHQNLKLVEYLVQKGADLQSNNNIALKIALAREEIAIVKFLVENGADVNAKCGNMPFLDPLAPKIKLAEIANQNVYTPLDSFCYYCGSKYYIIKQYSYYSDKNLISIDLTSNTPLCIASICRNKEIIEYLIQNGADVHANNDRALMWAKFGNDKDVISCLLRNGANVNADTDLVTVSKLKVKSGVLYDLFIENPT